MDGCTETGLFEILLQQCVQKFLDRGQLYEALIGASCILSNLGESSKIFLLCIGIVERRPECKVTDLLTQIDKRFAITTEIPSTLPASNIGTESNLVASQMGNKNSLRVNYKALNESCERFAQQDEDRRNRIAELNEEAAQQNQQNAVPRRKPTTQRRLERGERLDPDTDSSDGLRNFQSMPNVSEEPEQQFNPNSSPPRERRQTISQPIRIPGTTRNNPQISDLTVENVKLNSLQNSDIPSVLSFVEADSMRSTSDIQSPNVELVKCDDIVIHLDSMQSPSTRPGPSQVTPSSPYEPAIRDPSYFTRFLSPKYDRDNYLTADEPSRRIGSAPPDFMADFNPRRGVKIPRQRNFSTGLDGSVPPSTGFGFFPRPQRGQSLISFLQTVHFSSSNSELERENAHFSICQAVGCAIQQLKWNKRLKQFHQSRSDPHDTKSSPECGSNLFNVSSVSEDAFDEEKDEDVDRDSSSINNSNDSDLMSVSTVDIPSCTAYAEWAETTRETTSAEGIALSLLAKFNDRELPKASEINWMVFDNNGIGGVTDSRLGNCGDGSGPESSLGSSFCRGTNDWAPPRAQIIFTRRRMCSKKKVLEEQKYRCRGCGMHATAGRMSKFRLCGYTEQYYCTGCHRNQMSVIPARVLEEWDFKLQPVSVFAYRFLEDIWTNPVFNVETINPALYGRVRNLSGARGLRQSYGLVRSHLLACR